MSKDFKILFYLAVLILPISSSNDTDQCVTFYIDTDEYDCSLDTVTYKTHGLLGPDKVTWSNEVEVKVPSGNSKEDDEINLKNLRTLEITEAQHVRFTLEYKRPYFPHWLSHNLNEFLILLQHFLKSIFCT